MRRWMMLSALGRLPPAFVLAALLLSSARADAAEDFPPLPPPDPEVYLDRSGFMPLLGSQAALGAQVGSALTMGLFEDPLRRSSGAILGLGAGIALPILLTRDRPVPTGDTNYIIFSELAGLGNGFMLFMLLEPSLAVGPDSMLRGSMLSMAGGGLLGLGASLLTKDELDLMPGQAAAMGYSYLYGLFTGVMALELFDALGNQQAVMGTLLAFSNAGLLTTFLLRDHFKVDVSRLGWTNCGALLGALLGRSVAYLLAGGATTGRLLAGCSLVGFWAGAVLTYTKLVPPAGFRNRADLPAPSLVEIDETGSVNMGVPVPAVSFLPVSSAGERPRIATTFSLLHWRGP